MTTPTAPTTSPTPPPPSPPGVPRWIWMLMMLLFSSLVALGAGVLAHVGGDGIPDAIFTSAGAFAGTVLLLLAIAHFVARDR